VILFCAHWQLLLLILNIVNETGMDTAHHFIQMHEKRETNETYNVSFVSRS